MNVRFKRPSSPQVNPSSIARETDTSKRAKFRPLPLLTDPHQGARGRTPLFLQEQSDVSSPLSSSRSYDNRLPPASRSGSAIGQVAREEAEREQRSGLAVSRMERMMSSAPGADEGQVLQNPERDDGPTGDTAPSMTMRILTFHAPSAGNLAAAWYDPDERKIEVLEDTKDTISWDLAILVLEQVQPDSILMSSKTHLSLVDQVTKWDMDDQSSGDSFARHEVEYREEGAGMGYHRLSLVKLGCWVNVDAPLAVVSTGILVAEVKKELANSLTGDNASVSRLDLTSLESMNLEQHMLINKDALTSLAIFDTEAHAFVHSDVQKQALSVYGLLNRAVTPLGKKLMHTWHLRPLLNLSDIAARHDAVALFSSPDVIPVTFEIRQELQKIKNLASIFTKVRDGSGKYNEWAGLRQSLNALSNIKHIALNIPCLKSIDVLEKTQVAHLLSPRVPLGVTRDISVLYITQLGFHVVLQIDDSEPPEIPDWTKKFRIEDKVYYQCQETRELDAHYGDIVNLIRGREVEIMQELTERIHAQEPLILAAAEVVTELDCLLALAVAAKDLDLNRPIISEDKTLRIKNGRHLLYERVTERYIGNNTLLQGGKDGRYNSMMIVTGANGSGKSAYAKQVALIVFMAQIGSFVPAAEATIGICDKKSTSRHGSAFMIDLGQVSQALRGATDRSLIILDEFGKGTISCDGAGLLTGVIEHLLSTSCPRTIVATHFHELFTQSFIAEDQQVQFAHMKCLMAQDTKELHFFYKLDPRPCLTSYAAECALHHGVPKDIVDRARFVTECMSKFEFHKLHDTFLTPDQVKEARQAEQIAKAFFQWEVDEESEDVQEVLREMLERIEVNLQESNISDGDESDTAGDSGIGVGVSDEGSRLNTRSREDNQIDGCSEAPSDETD
ncbi:hypothetical protein IAU59_001472 [Kwoniella sp. CBS 9459]